MPIVSFQQSKRQATDFIVRKQRKGGAPDFTPTLRGQKINL